MHDTSDCHSHCMAVDIHMVAGSHANQAYSDTDELVILNHDYDSDLSNRINFIVKFHYSSIIL